MKFCRFIYKEGPRYGLIENVDGTEQITALLPGPQLQVSGAGVPERIVLPTDKTETLDKPLSLETARLLIPMPIVSKILCVGRNYREHAQELGNEVPTSPLIFSKPPSSLLAPLGEIRRPAISERVDYEGELGVVMGRTCRHMREDEHARDYILGYTCMNDVTARDLQKKDGQWTRAKGFDTFCPVGPVIATDLDPAKGLRVETKVNGTLRQQGTTADFIFSLDAIIRYISQFLTLMPGDLIATGTPSGVGPLQAGDVVEVSVERIGTLRNPVVND